MNDTDDSAAAPWTDAEYADAYEGRYAAAGPDYATIPWAELAPNTALVAWLGAQSSHTGQALIVGCGLGDDAEYVASQGFSVTAFDFSPSAVRLAKQRFPDSAVHYVVGDVQQLPQAWHGAFDLVVEIRTIQSMPTERRGDGLEAIAGLPSPGGLLFVHALGAPDGSNLPGPPWPVTPLEFTRLTAAGLQREASTRTPIQWRGSTDAYLTTAIYRRSGPR